MFCAVCSSDTDGDGFSNGDELGDPCCRWRGETPDRHATSQMSHPDFAQSTPIFASCLTPPAGVNVTLVGLFDGAAAPGDGGVTALLTLPPALKAASDGQCLCAVDVGSSSTAASASTTFRPPVSSATRTLVAVPLSAAQLGSAPAVGALLTIAVQAKSLASSSTTRFFTETVQARSSMPSGAVSSSNLQAPQVGTAAYTGTFYEINLPVMLAMGVGVVVTVLAVAVVFYGPCVPPELAAWCTNVRGKGKLQSRGFQVWKVASAALLLGSTAVSALMYAEMSFVTMAEAALGRALGNTALVLLFASMVSASHHLVLHWAGVSYDRSVFGHMTLGTTAILASVVHGAWMVFSANIDGVRVPVDIDAGGTGAAWALGHWTQVASVNPLAGTLSGVFGVTLLYFPGRRCARQHAYAFFYILHILGAILTVLFALLHIANSGLNVVVTLVIPAVVIFAERALLAMLHGAALSGRVSGARVVGDVGSGLVYFTVKQRAVGPAPSAGQWVSMVVPSLSLLQHPISLAGVTHPPPTEADEAPPPRLLHFIVRAMHDVQPGAEVAWYKRAQAQFMSLFRAGTSWSRKLASTAVDGSAEGALVLLYEPPLGRHTQPHHIVRTAEHHVFFAGGVGVTAVLQSAAKCAVQPGRVGTLVWALREEALAQEGIVLLAQLLKEQPQARQSSKAQAAEPVAAAAAAVAAADHAVDNGEQGIELPRIGEGASVPPATAAAAVAPYNLHKESTPASINCGELRLHLHLTATKAATVAVQPIAAAVVQEVDAKVVPISEKEQAHDVTGQPEEEVAALEAPTATTPLQAALDELQGVCNLQGVKLQVTLAASGTRPVPLSILQSLHANPPTAMAGSPPVARSGGGSNGVVCAYVCGPAALSQSVTHAVEDMNGGVKPGAGKGGVIHPRPRVLLHVEQFGW